MAILNYVEVPTGDAGAARRFYAAAFGWTFTDYGPDYAAVEGVGADLGLNGVAGAASRAVLPVIEVAALEAAQAAVEAAGGTVTRPIYAFPGGRRFHFTDPDGNELAVYVKEG